MRAIVTKYIGPSNVKGPRVKAIEIYGKYVMSSWRDEWDTDRNHREACRDLCQRLGWKGHMVTGYIKGACVHTFVVEPVLNQSFIVP